MGTDAVCVCTGPQHVIERVNPEFIEASGIDPRGIPAREAFVGYDHLQALMDEVYATGESREVDCDDGWWVCLPRYHHGCVVGVVTGWRAHLALVLPEPLLLASPAA